MISVKQMERLAAPVTRFVCLLCLAGLWALMTLPKGDLAILAATHQNTPLMPLPEFAPTPAPLKARLPAWLPSGKQRLVDPALLLAIIKQESGFNPKARSSAGARGLMQIMPATARYMITRYRLNEIKIASTRMPRLPEPISVGRLNHPQVNLTIGQHYIRYLNEKSYIDGNLIYMLAAYNAGPGNLIRWQKRFADTQTPRRFMQQIPFKETRRYVQKVMRNYIAYQKHLYGYSSAEAALEKGIWPTLNAPI